MVLATPTLRARWSGDTIVSVGLMSRMLELLFFRGPSRVRESDVPRARPVLAGCLRAFAVIAVCGLTLATGFAWLRDVPAARADAGFVSVRVRVEGPADRVTFGQTGVYETVWSGEVEVPRELTVTANNGRQYHLFVEDGIYKSTRLDNGETSVLGAGDDALGATSVLAALDAGSRLGGFGYQVTDSFYPGQGFFVTSIAGEQGSGAIGWSYRVWNDTVAASPQDSVERFLLGYDSASVPPPHIEVLFYWGYANRCLPLRVSPLESEVRSGAASNVVVEAFVDGAGSEGYWVPVPGATVCTGGLCQVTGEDGEADFVLTQLGVHSFDACAGYDGSYYYVPAGGASVEVSGPYEVISFTLVDHGEQGINFGRVVPGTVSAPERAQTAGSGAVTLQVGSETTVDCDVQLRGTGGLEGDGTPLPLEGVTWGLNSSGDGAVPVTPDYVTIAQVHPAEATDIEVWHWITIPAGQAYGSYSGQFYYRVIGEVG